MDRDDRLHGGDYVDVYLESRGVDRPDEPAVPNGALIQFEAGPVVFRQNADGDLSPVEVRSDGWATDRSRRACRATRWSSTAHLR